MAAEHVISYRLGDSEVKSIRALQLPGEKSISITAKRLLRSALESSIEKSTSEPTGDSFISVDKMDEVVDTVVDSDKLKEKLEEMLSSLVSSINQKLIEQEERLEAIEKPMSLINLEQSFSQAENQNTKPTGNLRDLSGNQLAKRLRVSESTVRRRKDKPDFSEWSRSLDSDGIAWNYYQASQQFSPLPN